MGPELCLALGHRSSARHNEHKMYILQRVQPELPVRLEDDPDDSGVDDSQAARSPNDSANAKLGTTASAGTKRKTKQTKENRSKAISKTPQILQDLLHGLLIRRQLDRQRKTCMSLTGTFRSRFSLPKTSGRPR